MQEEGAEARWASVVQGLLRGRVRLGEEDLAETDGIAGVRRVLKGARGAAIAAFPTLSVAGSVTVPLQPDLDRQVARLFGFRSPVPVIVQNGAGAPGLGQDVAAVLLPLGFRVVLSQNADLFGYERTRVVANGNGAHRGCPPDREGARGRARRRLAGTIGYRRHHDHRGGGLHRVTSGDQERGGGPIPPSRDTAAAAARAASSKQAQDIVVLNVSELIVITDHFVICTAGIHPSDQARSSTRSSAPSGSSSTSARPGGKGRATRGWWLLDYIDVVVHVFGPEERAFYDLERLWRDAPRLDWEEPDAVSSAR